MFKIDALVLICRKIFFMMKTIGILSFFLLFNLCVSAQQKLVPVDAESKVHFVIRNFGIGTGGDLKGLKGQIIFDKNNIAASSFDITVDVSTIDTESDMRDNHLLKADYFDVAKYPTIRITGRNISASGNGYILKANLTIKDVTKAIEIPFTATPQKAGYLFEGDFEINRLHYHVGEESATMADKLKITLKVLAK